jgi:hypothetical protein
LSVITPFPHPRDRRPLTAFDRLELRRILDLYGRMVAAGHWRDYSMHFGTDVASFAAFRAPPTVPMSGFRKRPELLAKQGAYSLVSEHGAVLKRGHELSLVLAPLERRLMRLVRD